MLSGIGDPEELQGHGIAPQHDLPAVGRNLSDHPMAISLFDASGKDSLFAAEKSIQLVAPAAAAPRGCSPPTSARGRLPADQGGG